MVNYVVEDATAAIYVNGVIHWVTSGSLPVLIKPGDKISATFHARIERDWWAPNEPPSDIAGGGTWFPAMYILTQGCDGWGGGFGTAMGTSYGDYTVSVPVYTVPSCMDGKTLIGKLGIYQAADNKKLGEGSAFYIESYVETSGTCPPLYAWINVSIPFAGANIYLDNEFYANSVLGGNVVCVPQGYNHTIMVTYPGYNTFEQMFDVTSSMVSSSKVSARTITVPLTKTPTATPTTPTSCPAGYYLDQSVAECLPIEGYNQPEESTESDTTIPGSGGLPTAILTATPTTGTAPLTVKFNGKSNGTAPITDWYWDFGDGYTDGGVDTSHTYSVAGQYNVTLTVGNANGYNYYYTTITAGSTSSTTIPVTSCINKPCSATCPCPSGKTCGSTGVCTSTTPPASNPPPSGTPVVGTCPVCISPKVCNPVSKVCYTPTTGTPPAGAPATPCDGMNRNGALDPTCIIEPGNEMFLYGAVGVVLLLLLMKKK